MRDFQIINIMGSNGTGKSTRVYRLVRYLMEKYDHEDFIYPVTRKGQTKNEKIGIKFSNGWLIVGKFVKNNTQWVSLDSAVFSKWEYKINFMKDIAENYPEINTILMEGYFNNSGKNTSPEALLSYGASKARVFLLFYNDISEYIQRTNGRTGKNRGMEWAENSAGWKDNRGYKRWYETFLKEHDGETKIVKRIQIDEPKDYFVREFFNDTYEIDSNSGSDKPQEINEWF